MSEQVVVTGTEALQPQAPAPTPAPTPSAPATHTLQLGGRPIELPPEVADAFRRELNTRDGRHGAQLQQLQRELQTLREQVAPPAPAAPQGPTPPKAELLQYDPGEYERQMTQYVDAVSGARIAEYAAYQQQQQEQLAQEAQRRATWDRYMQRFYQQNPDLQGEEGLVDLVWRESYTDLAALPVDQGFDALAHRTRERIVRIADKGKTIKAPTLETSRRSAASVAATPETPDEPEVGGLSRVVRLQQARMRGYAVAS